MDAELSFRFLSDADKPSTLRLPITRHCAGDVISGTGRVESVMYNDFCLVTFYDLLTCPRVRVPDILCTTEPLPVRSIRIGVSIVVILDRAPDIRRKVAVALALTADMQNKEIVW